MLAPRWPRFCRQETPLRRSPGVVAAAYNPSMQARPYGGTGILVSALGLGAGQLGDARLEEAQAADLIAAALDGGITLIDTAPSYGLSEQRLGRHLGARRDQVVLSTKLGYGVEGIPDWTGPCITAGVEQALRVLRTDRLDIAHLHSCPWPVLAADEVIAALVAARDAGKVRAIACSGENEDLAYALGRPEFDGYMASLNLFDQRVIDDALPRLGGRGFIAKRPVANHPWRFTERPVGDYCEPYWERWQAMGLDSGGLDWGESALRFALSIPGVSSAIVGTGRPEHLREALAWAAQGPLAAADVARWRDGFRAHDRGWTGQV
jgi:aryl-alcohol dehydrogenase-like predicted oxidoreductase